MLALDIHETFDEEDNEVQTGERLKTTILNRGSGDVAKELFKRFQVSFRWKNAGKLPFLGVFNRFLMKKRWKIIKKSIFQGRNPSVGAICDHYAPPLTIQEGMEASENERRWFLIALIEILQLKIKNRNIRRFFRFLPGFPTLIFLLLFGFFLVFFCLVNRVS